MSRRLHEVRHHRSSHSPHRLVRRRARLEEAVHLEAHTLDIDDDVREQLLAASASTMHRLLGWKPGNRARFRHDRSNRLPHEVVIVDRDLDGVAVADGPTA